MAKIYRQCAKCYNVQEYDNEIPADICPVCGRGGPAELEKNGATVTAEGNLYKGCNQWPVRVGETLIYNGDPFSDHNDAGFPTAGKVAEYQIAKFQET